MSEVLLKQLIHEVKSLRARMNALETAEVIPSQLQASDGDPNPALSADASGNLAQAAGLYIATDEIRALGGAGLGLYEYTGALGILVQHTTGYVGLNTDTPHQQAHLVAAGTVYFHITNDTTGHAASDGADIGFYTGQSKLTIVNREANQNISLQTTGTGSVVLNSLAGSGSRTVVADANGVLSAP